MKKSLVVASLIIVVGLVAFASDDARQTQVTGLQNLNTDAPKATYLIDYFDAGSASTYTWNGQFYMSNMFKPAAAGVPYPFWVSTVEVFPGGIDGQTTTGATGTIDGVRVFAPMGTGSLTVAAEMFGIQGSARVWNAVNFATATAATIASGDFFAGMWNSTSLDLGLQGSATGWTGPPVEPMDCINTAGGGGSANAAGPWFVHSSGACGDQYGTTSAAAVRVVADDSIPVELMTFTAE